MPATMVSFVAILSMHSIITLSRLIAMPLLRVYFRKSETATIIAVADAFCKSIMMIAIIHHACAAYALEKFLMCPITTRLAAANTNLDVRHLFLPIKILITR